MDEVRTWLRADGQVQEEAAHLAVQEDAPRRGLCSTLLEGLPREADEGERPALNPALILGHHLRLLSPTLGPAA